MLAVVSRRRSEHSGSSSPAPAITSSNHRLCLGCVNNEWLETVETVETVTSRLVSRLWRETVVSGLCEVEVCVCLVSRLEESGRAKHSAVPGSRSGGGGAEERCGPMAGEHNTTEPATVPSPATTRAETAT